MPPMIKCGMVDEKLSTKTNDFPKKLQKWRFKIFPLTVFTEFKIIVSDREKRLNISVLSGKSEVFITLYSYQDKAGLQGRQTIFLALNKQLL